MFQITGVSRDTPRIAVIASSLAPWTTHPEIVARGARGPQTVLHLIRPAPSRLRAIMKRKKKPEWQLPPEIEAVLNSSMNLKPCRAKVRPNASRPVP